MSVVTFETKSVEERIVCDLTETCKQTENCVWPSDRREGRPRPWNLSFQFCFCHLLAVRLGASDFMPWDLDLPSSELGA